MDCTFIDAQADNYHWSCYRRMIMMVCSWLKLQWDLLLWNSPFGSKEMTSMYKLRLVSCVVIWFIHKYGHKNKCNRTAIPLSLSIFFQLFSKLETFKSVSQIRQMNTHYYPHYLYVNCGEQIKSCLIVVFQKNFFHIWNFLKLNQWKTAEIGNK